MYGLAVNLIVSLSGHLSNIDEMQEVLFVHVPLSIEIERYVYFSNICFFVSTQKYVRGNKKIVHIMSQHKVF